MKKVFILVVVVVFTSLFFTSCTENIITDDEELVFQTQATDKEDSVNPGGSGQGGEEGENEEG
jgi:hypothetical protein